MTQPKLSSGPQRETRGLLPLTSATVVRWETLTCSRAISNGASPKGMWPPYQLIHPSHSMRACRLITAVAVRRLSRTEPHSFPELFVLSGGAELVGSRHHSLLSKILQSLPFCRSLREVRLVDLLSTLTLPAGSRGPDPPHWRTVRMVERP